MKLIPALLLSAAAALTPLYASGACSCGATPAATVASAADAKSGKLIPLGENDAAWAAKARTSYPLKTCVISDEALGSMGKPAEYIYRVSGRPDRLVIFCCDACEEDFLKSPEMALQKIDQATGKRPAAAKKA